MTSSISTLTQETLTRLLQEFPYGEVTPLYTIHEGVSGARVLVVDIKSTDSRCQDGLAFAKIDIAYRCIKEFQNHAYIRSSRIREHVPAIIGDAPMGMVNGWSAVFYQPAKGTVQHSISLGNGIESHKYSVNQIAKQVELLIDEILKNWYHIDPKALTRGLIEIPELFRSLINIGDKSRFSSLGERARSNGFTGEQHQKIIFLPGDLVLPNPFAYILSEQLWNRNSELERIVVPLSEIHGDLHSGNVICQSDYQWQLLQTTPWLIDFAQFEENKLPFFDLAYLELDLLLRYFKVTSEQDWLDWMQLIQHITSNVLPTGHPPGLTSSASWLAVMPIRQYVNRLLKQIRGELTSIDEQFEASWWIASTAVGVRYARRIHEKASGEHKVALLYAACSLGKLLELLNRPLSKQIPFPVQWIEGSAKLNEEMVKSYCNGLFREQRSILLGQTINLTGEIDEINIGNPLELPSELMDSLLAELYFPNVMPQQLSQATVIEDAREYLRHFNRIVLLGEPGSGKTTTLKLLALDYISAHEKDPTSPLPVFVPLSKYDTKRPFSEFASTYLGNLRAYARYLNLVWILDSFNEMPRQVLFSENRDVLAELKVFLSDKHFVISCRARDYYDDLSDLDELYKIKLRNLTPVQIHEAILKRLPRDVAEQLWSDIRGNDALIESWKYFMGFEDEFWYNKNCPEPVQMRYLNLAKMDEFERKNFLNLFSTQRWRVVFPVAYFEHEAARHAMHSDPRKLILMCRNPYTLGVIIDLVHRVGLHGIPGNRALLFSAFVKVLISREAQIARNRNQPWNPDTEGRMRNILTQLAGLIQRTEQRTEIYKSTVLGNIEFEDMEELFLKCESANLINYGDRVSFTHQLLQEYFATDELRQALESNESPHRFVSNNWWENGPWDQTMMILGELLQDATLVARWLSRENPHLALEVLMASYKDRFTHEIALETKTALIEGAMSKTQERNSIGRAVAWRVVGILGEDKRPGVGLKSNGLPDVMWCDIPEGNFQLGSPEHDAYALMNEKPLQTINCESFSISKYPVTVCQFQSFVRTGYNDPQYWSAMGREWKLTQKQTSGNSPILNTPQVDVSWYEATAYCNWLTDEYRKAGFISTTQFIRLPTEIEWEYAAKGDDGRYYPWGNNFDPNNCNMSETGIGMVCSVGIFPDGSSLYGVHDMSGNVWEWCSSSWRRYYSEIEENYENQNTFVARLLRGGAYNSGRREVRCAHRHMLLPGGKLHPVGFRIVSARNLS